MHTLTSEDLEREPQRLLDDAQRGETNLVTRDGAPLLVVVPLDGSAGSQRIRLEVASSKWRSTCTTRTRSVWGWLRASRGWLTDP